MAGPSTPEAPPDSPQDAAPKAPEAPKPKPIIPEGAGGDGATQEVTDAQRKKIIAELHRDHGSHGSPKDTPWQHARDWTREPLKKGTKLGLFALNPVVYGSVYGADWLAQRTPGVKNLYAKPREIIRGTADKAMNVVNAGVTLVPSLPSTVAHEVHDKVAGMDVSKPTNLVGKVIDKIGDFVGTGLNLTKATLGKVAEIGKKYGKPILEGGMGIIAAPFKAIGGIIGSLYGGLQRTGGIIGGVGQLALTGLLIVGGHTAISGALAAFAPAALPVYQGLVATLQQSFASIFGL